MKVEIWTDIICPWCYIGRRRFEKALTQFSGRATVDVVYRSFELDPNAPARSEMNVVERLMTKYGLSAAEAREANQRVTKIAEEEGLEFHLDRVRPAAEERFQMAYFTEGAPLAEPETLLRLATEAGLKEEDARHVLAGQAF